MKRLYTGITAFATVAVVLYVIASMSMIRGMNDVVESTPTESFVSTIQAA
jgi:hypothetical protein